MTEDKTIGLRMWVKRPNQASVPSHPEKVLSAEKALIKFASNRCGPESVAKKWLVKVEAMDEFTSKGWERVASVAILYFRQMPRAMLGIILESPEEYSAWIMVETKLAGVPDTTIAWQPEFMIGLESTVYELEGLLDVFWREGILINGANGLQYTGKRPSFLR